MKVMHVMAGGDAGGAEMAYVDLCIAQKQAGMDIIAACRPNKHRNAILRNAGVTVYEFPFGKWFDFKTRPGLKKLIRKEKPAIAQCWMSRAASLMPNPSKDLPPFAKIARLGGYYNMKYYRGVQHFIGNTPDIRRWLIEEQNKDPQNVTYVNNFAELDPVSRPLKKSDFDTNDNDFVFLSLARLHHVKALDTALYALAKVPNAVLWFAGEGPEKDNLVKLAEELNISDRVRFLGWRTDRSAVLEACDAVLFPSRYEAFGGTFIQAWAAKRPLVTTSAQGPSQYVINGENGLMVAIDDVDALADAMNIVVNDAAIREKIVANAYEDYKRQFTKESVLNTYNTLYKNLYNSL